MANLFNYISDFFNDFEGCEPVNISIGNQRVENVNAKARVIAEEKDWFSQTNSQIKMETYLMQFEFSVKLVWFVYFTHLFDQKEKENFEAEYSSMRFAVVRIDDKSSDILFADFIVPQII